MGGDLPHFQFELHLDRGCAEQPFVVLIIRGSPNRSLSRACLIASVVTYSARIRRYLPINIFTFKPDHREWRVVIRMVRVRRTASSIVMQVSVQTLMQDWVERHLAE